MTTIKKRQQIHDGRPRPQERVRRGDEPMKVLYAVDGFDASLAAGRLVAEMFRVDGAAITVASVTPRGSLDPGHLILELDPLESRRTDSAEIVRVAEDKLKRAGFKTRSTILEGQPAKELIRELDRNEYDVVVVGSGNHTWAGAHLLGSVSTRILHEAPCSVLVAHEFRETDDVRAVLVSVDGSQSAIQTVHLLAELLDARRVQARVVSVALMVLPVVPILAVGQMSTNESVAELEKQAASQAEEHVTDAVGVLRMAGFQAEAEVQHGHATTAILEEAHKNDFDLVGVGSRGLGPVRRALLGSVSDQVARHAPAAFVGRPSFRPTDEAQWREES